MNDYNLIYHSDRHEPSRWMKARAAPLKFEAARGA